ncbi:MAG: Y-family DNA polymerase [Myxococcota bacterium]
MHQGRGTHARVLYCNDLARREGVRPGQSLAAARGRIASLDSRPFARRHLVEEQRRVVERLLHVTPRITTAGADRFWVEPLVVGRARHGWDHRAFEIFGRDVARVVDGHGPVSVGIGPTATVAWAAACSLDAGHGGHRFVLPDAASTFLDEAPLEVLEIDGEALDILASLGIRRVGELRALDPVSLGMRFGPAVADARRRADGHDPRGPRTAPPTVRNEVCIELDDEVDGVEPLLFLLQPAADQLTRMLRRRDQGAVHVRLELGLTGRPPTGHALEVRTAAPLTRGRTLLELLRTRLERTRLTAPAHRIRLEAMATAPLSDRTPPLLRTRPRRDPDAQEVALDRLRNRLGETSVRRAERVETGAVLERARWMFARECGASARGDAMPWRRLDSPVPVVDGRARVAGRWRRVCKVGRVERAGAPWWDDGEHRVSLVAWAELEGPLLVLMHARCGTDCDDRWEVLAWVD